MIRTFSKLFVVSAVMLLAVGCAQQQQEEAPPAETPEMEMEEPAPMTEIELTPEKVNELATISVQMDRNPTAGADILMQYNMTQEQYSDAMMRVQADSTMAMMFEQAKAAAAAAMPDSDAAGTMTDSAAGH